MVQWLKTKYRDPAFWICAIGLLALAMAYGYWCLDMRYTSAVGRLTALVCVGLFALMCLRFVPNWMDWWLRPEVKTDLTDHAPRFVLLRVFLLFLGFCGGTILLVYAIRVLEGYSAPFRYSLDVWMKLDSEHYIDIAAEWYLSEGPTDRVVQLVFLPGYPVIVRLVNRLFYNFQFSAMLVSAVSFACAGCVLYKLLRLDVSHKAAMRTLKYVCLLPGAFFYAAPMSESLFLLMCVSSIYCARKQHWPAAGLLGAYAAFTRSLGLMLVAPLAMELIRDILHKEGRWKQAAAVLLVPAGFGAYCLINYQVSGDPLKFMEYQSQHWYQNLYLFFNTASYMMEYILGSDAGMITTILGMWVPNLIYIFGSLLIMAAAAKKLRPSYTAWFIPYYAVAIGATWLMSGPRYLMACAALPMALGHVTEKKWADFMATVVCLVLSVLYIYMFIHRWQVW